MVPSKKLKPRLKKSRAIAPSEREAITIQQLSMLLKLSLAAYVQARAKEPISVVMEDLFEIEFEAAALVDISKVGETKNTNLRGALASVFSAIPFRLNKQIRDVTLIEHAFPANHERRKQFQGQTKRKGME